MNKDIMTKEQFKIRWEGDDKGGGITFDDLADCAVAWGISRSPRACPMNSIRYVVLKAAGTVDAEKFNPDNEEDYDEGNAAKIK